MVIVEPAPMVAPLPTITGAINCELDPINTLSSIIKIKFGTMVQLTGQLGLTEAQGRIQSHLMVGTYTTTNLNTMMTAPQ